MKGKKNIFKNNRSIFSPIKFLWRRDTPRLLKTQKWHWINMFISYGSSNVIYPQKMYIRNFNFMVQKEAVK